MSDTFDLAQLLVRAFEMLRMHQENLLKNTLATTALVNALKESNPTFAAAYDKQYWELKQGPLGEQNAVAVRVIDEITRKLKDQAHAAKA